MQEYKKIIGNVAAFFATIALGALSFAGMMVITSSLGWALVAFFLGAAVEGAVYQQNIFAAMKKLGDHEGVIRRAIAKRELENLRNNNTLYLANDFLQDYFKQKKYLHDLAENSENYNAADKAKAKKEMTLLTQRIEMMEDVFINAIMKKETEYPAGVTALMTSVTITKATIEQEIIKKQRYMNISIVVALGSGVAAGFVTLSSISTGLLALGLGIGTATAVGFPIAGFAALGYAFVAYHTLTDMIKDEIFIKWSKRIKQFWHTPKQERHASYYLGAVGVVLLLGLAILATIATAGTWWYLAKNGANLIQPLAGLAGSVLSITAWALSIVPGICFSFVNALKSANKIPSLLRNTFNDLSGRLKKTWSEENFFQFINPFRLINKTINAAIFVGHLISIGLTSDQVPWFHPIQTIIINGFMEGAGDLHFVTDDHHTHEAKKTSHGHEGHTCSGDHAHDHVHLNSSTDAHKSHGSHHHAHDEDDHHHQHGDFITKKVNALFNYLALGWDALGGWVGSFGANKQTASVRVSENSTHHTSSTSWAWADSKEKFFPSSGVLPEIVKTSEEWQKFENKTVVPSSVGMTMYAKLLNTHDGDTNNSTAPRGAEEKIRIAAPVETSQSKNRSGLFDSEFFESVPVSTGFSDPLSQPKPLTA